MPLAKDLRGTGTQGHGFPWVLSQGVAKADPEQAGQADPRGWPRVALWGSPLLVGNKVDTPSILSRVSSPHSLKTCRVFVT